MNPFRKAYCRLYQSIFALLAHFLPFHEPNLIEGEGSLVEKLPALLQSKGLQKPLIVMDRVLFEAKMQDGLLGALKGQGMEPSFYGKINHEPTFSMVEEIVSFYLKENCDSLIAFGGGSCLDAAKAAGARIANPNRSISQLKGVLKVRKRLPFFVAVPTTAGTGSEATVAAVVTNEESKDKFSISDPKLIPDVAVLDSSYLKSLPKMMIANTGLDALTHAVEAYINHHATKKSKLCSLASIADINRYLIRFYEDPDDVKARSGMLKASYLAGVSFTRSYVGYVHALAHSLGGYYHLPHGFCCALFLPYVLKAYSPKADSRLAKLSDLLELTDPSQSKNQKAEAFLSWLSKLYQKLDIPEKVSGIILEEDVEKMAIHSEKEANPLYPCPKILDVKELKELFHEVKA